MSVSETAIQSQSLMELLSELALDLGVAWNRYSDKIWRQIDPEIWMSTRNPWLMLQLVSNKMLDEMPKDQGLRPSGRKARPRPAQGESDPGMVSEAPYRFAAQRGRVLQHGIRPQRSAPDLLRGARQRGRRSAQGRRRSARPDRGRRIAFISRATSARQSIRMAISATSFPTIPRRGCR